MSTIERAWLTAGGDIFKRGSKQFFRLDVENQGRTAGFLTGYDVQFARLKDLKKEPVRKVDPKPYSDGLAPSGGRRTIFTDIQRKAGDDAVFGAVWYDDVFGKDHCTRFILRIAPTADIKGHGLTRLTGLGDVADYATWDYGA